MIVYPLNSAADLAAKYAAIRDISRIKLSVDNIFRCWEA